MNKISQLLAKKCDFNHALAPEKGVRQQGVGTLLIVTPQMSN